MFKFKPEFCGPTRQNYIDRVLRLADEIEVIRSLSAGPDVVRSSRSWDFAIVADFDRVEDIQEYTHHPAHVPLIHISGPNSELIVSVDFEI